MSEHTKVQNMVQQKLQVIPTERKQNTENSTVTENAHKDKNGASNTENTSNQVKETINTDEASTTSNQTQKVEPKSHHYNDSEDNESWQAESEDEQNTVSSDKTSKIKKRDEHKVVLPKFTRYQMMILLDQGPENDNGILDSKESDKSPSQRIKEFLADFAKRVKKEDKDAKIMSWKTGSNFTYLGDEFPTDIAEVSRYFSGFRKNLKADKRVYLRVAIHTPNSETKLRSNLIDWMRVFGYIINKCIIQAETSTCIGWLVYSSQNTDTQVLKELLMNESNFEWGFKMVAVTESDSSLPWLKRARAVGVYVPTPFKDIAINIIGKAFEASLDSQINVPDVTDKYLFIETERMHKGNKSKEIYYTRMVERHRVHTESLIAEPSYGIKVDLDKVFNVDPKVSRSEFKKLSIRDILLDLKVETPNHPLHGTSLFHSVDYFEDSSNLWLNGEKCDGKPCCIFTYYDLNASEASTMVKGMGKMVMKEFGTDMASEIFTYNHYQGNSGYRWNSLLRRFSTPEMRRMKANKSFDHNLPAITVLLKQKQEKEKEEEKKKVADMKRKNASNPEQTRSKKVAVDELAAKGNIKADEKPEETPQSNESQRKNDTEVIDVTDDVVLHQHGDDDDDSHALEEIKNTQLQKLVKVRNDKDLDELDDNSNASPKPYDINVEDDHSVTSTLTNVSIGSRLSIISEHTTNEDQADDITLSSMKSKFGITSSLIEKLAKEGIKDGLTPSQLEQQVLSYQALKFNEAKTAASVAVAKFLQSTSLQLHKEMDQSGSNDQSTLVSPPAVPPSENSTVSVSVAQAKNLSNEISAEAKSSNHPPTPPPVATLTSSAQLQTKSPSTENTVEDTSNVDESGPSTPTVGNGTINETGQSSTTAHIPSSNQGAKIPHVSEQEESEELYDQRDKNNPVTKGQQSKLTTRKKQKASQPPPMTTRSQNVRTLRNGTSTVAGDVTSGIGP